MTRRYVTGREPGYGVFAWTGASALKWASHIQSRRSRSSRCMQFVTSGAEASGSFIIRNASQWCRSPAAIPSDVALAAYAVRLNEKVIFLSSSKFSCAGLATNSDA